MPPVISDLRTWPENCFSSFKSEKHRPQDLDLAKDLVRPRLEDGLGVVDAELVRGDQLHRALFFRNVCCRHVILHLILAKMVSGIPMMRKNTCQMRIYALFPWTYQCRSSADVFS